MASIYRGDNTGAFGNDFLRIYLKSPSKLIITKAVVQINHNLEKVYDYPKFPLTVNFTGEETKYLDQQNTCRMALWDEYGRRRTAEGKFNFYVKENRIMEPDAPTGGEPEGVVENSITFDLDSSEIACEFVINATPQKMSELEQDVEFLGFDKIVGGRNVETWVNEDDQLVIDADLETTIYYENIEHKPKINGQVLEGDITVTAEQVNSDWNATSGAAEILNKPEFADVALTGDYDDLENTPNIPTKLSELENDEHFITKETGSLENYYTKNQIDDKLDVLVDLDPVYDRIDDVESTLDGRITPLENQIEQKVDFTTFNTELAEKADTQDLIDGLAGKLNASELGNGTLKIKVNDELKTEFAANEKYNKTVNIEVPTKLSDLNQDIAYVREGEIVLEGYVKEEELNERLADYVTPEEIGHGILTIQKNGENIGAFSANSEINKTINVTVPTKFSELEKDISVVTEDDLEDITNDLSRLQSKITTCESTIIEQEQELRDKVDKVSGKDLISISEIARLSNVDNYNDTEVRELIRDNTDSITSLTDEIALKVDKISGKGLSTNDFSDNDKNNLQINTNDIAAVKIDITRLNESDEDQTNKINAMDEDIVDLKQGLQDEATVRVEKITELEARIDGLSTKATVVDIVQSKAELDEYDISQLQVGDAICVLIDETHEDAAAYYKLNELGQMIYVGCETKSYTTAQSDARFVPQTRAINGFTLDRNIEITPENMGAARPADIKNGVCALQIEPKNMAGYTEVTELETFSANSETNKTFRVPVPTKTSHLLNDADFVDVRTLTGTKNELNESINTVAGDLSEVREDLDDLAEIVTGGSEYHGFQRVAYTGNYEDLNNKPTLVERSSQLFNDIGFVQMREVDTSVNNRFYMEDILDDFEARVKVTKVSELENDRGYVTNNGIGKGVLTFNLNNIEIGSWMANEKYNQTLNIPVDSTLSDESTFPVENRVIKARVDGIDESAVHKAGAETITGVKTFDANVITNNITMNGNVLATKEVAQSDNSNTVVTTKWFRTYTDTNVVHKTGNQPEEITGIKTFTANVLMSSATLLNNPTPNDNSLNVPTCRWVKSIGYAMDNTVVHRTGVQNEGIQGNKTFSDIVTFNGEVNLSASNHVPTPDGTTNTAITNVAYVTSVKNDIAEDLDDAVTALETSISTNVNTINTRIDNEIIGVNTTINTKEEQIYQSINNAMNIVGQDIQAVQDDLDEYKRQEQNKKTFVELTDGVNYLIDNGLHTLTPTGSVTLILPTIAADDMLWHEIHVQIALNDDYDVDLNARETLSGIGVYDVHYIWHNAAQRWNCRVYKYDDNLI